MEICIDFFIGNFNTPFIESKRFECTAYLGAPRELIRRRSHQSHFEIWILVVLTSVKFDSFKTLTDAACVLRAFKVVHPIASWSVASFSLAGPNLQTVAKICFLKSWWIIHQR